MRLLQGYLCNYALHNIACCENETDKRKTGKKEPKKEREREKYLGPHKDVMTLLVADGEPPLSLGMLVGEGLEVADGVALGDGEGELDVGFCVFVTGLFVFSGNPV